MSFGDDHDHSDYARYDHTHSQYEVYGSAEEHHSHRDLERQIETATTELREHFHEVIGGLRGELADLRAAQLLAQQDHLQTSTQVMQLSALVSRTVSALDKLVSRLTGQS